MKSLETLKNEPASAIAGNVEEGLEKGEEKRAENAESFENEMRSVEAKRLQKPEGSAYDNLKKFGRRAVAMGSLISSLAAAPSALSQTYHPYIEVGTFESLNTGSKTVSFDSYKKKTPELEARLKEVRRAVEQKLARIGETEKLSLAKLDVDIIVNPLDIRSADQLMDADFSHERILLRVRIYTNFDLKKHGQALEAMLAHEIGHFINERADQDISKQDDEAMRQALQEDSGISKEWTALEAKKHDIESAKSPQINKIRDKIKELTRKLAVEDLTAVEGQTIRKQLDSLESQEVEITGDFIETDVNYRKIRDRLQEIEESLAEKKIPYLIKQGGREVIADFFQARWAVKQGWSVDELREAMKILIGESGRPTSPLYGPSIEERHKLAQFLFSRIKMEPEKYYKVGNNSQEIHNCVESLYREFSEESK